MSRDVHFEEAGKFIIEKEKASIGMLQRMFKIGFNRAARIMDQLCDAGVVGPEEGTKPKESSYVHGGIPELSGKQLSNKAESEICLILKRYQRGRFMKCPKCHKEVEKGSLYCPHCLAGDPVGQGVRFCRNTDEETAAEKARKREKENRIQAEKTWKKTDHPAAYSSSGHSG